MFDDPIFFDGWGSLLSILISAPFVYVLVIVAVRIAGKRSMSQLNNFDWVVTVAMGAVAALSIVLASVTVLDAAVAIGTLLLLQIVTTYATSRSRRAEQIIKADAAFLVVDGQFLTDQLAAHRLSEGDIRSVLREGGYTSLSQIRWVVLEADARISIIPNSDKNLTADTLADVPPVSVAS